MTRAPELESWEFGGTIEVHPDGTVTRAPADVWAPECPLDPDVRSTTLDGYSEWRLLTGYSGQDRYSGPWMHDSEYLGAGCTMVRDILAEAGYYALIYAQWTPEDGGEDSGEDAETDIEGWAVAYREAPERED